MCNGDALIMNLGVVDFKVYLLKVFFIALFTNYTFLKISNNKVLTIKKYLISFFYISITAIIVTIIKYKFNYFMSIALLVLLLSIILF